MGISPVAPISAPQTAPSIGLEQWYEKMGLTEETKPTGFMQRLFDVILAGQYGSAGIAKQMVERKKPPLPWEIPSDIYKGLQERASYRDVAVKLGVSTEPMAWEKLPPWTSILGPWAVLGRLGIRPSPADIAGLAGDIFLDPATYLGLGIAARGAKAGKAFGLTFARRAIPGLAIPKEGAAYLKMMKGLEAAKALPVVKELRAGFGAIARPLGVKAEQWAAYLPLVRKYRSMRQYREVETIKEAMKMAKGASPEERVALMYGLERPFRYTKSVKEIKELIPLRKEVWETVDVKVIPWADRIKKLDEGIEAAIKDYDTIVKPLAEDLAKQAREAQKVAGEWDLFRQIKERGGIATPPPGMWAGEWKESIPLFLKKKTGLPLDEMARSFGKTVPEFLDDIAQRQMAGKFDWRSFESQAAELLDQYQNRAFLAASDRLFKLNNLRDRLQDMAFARGPKVVGQERVKGFVEEMVEQPRLIETIKKVPRLEGELEKRRKEIASLYEIMYKGEKERKLIGAPVKYYAPHYREGAKPWLRFGKARTIPEALEDIPAKYGFQIFETDAYATLAKRGVAHERAILTHDFIDNVLNNPAIGRPFTKGAKIAKDEALYLPKARLQFQPTLKTLTAREAKRRLEKGFQETFALGVDDLLEEVTQQTLKGIPVPPGEPVAWILPKGIAENMNQMGKTFISDESTNAFIKGYDKVLNIWKLYATAMRLPFHLRNLVSNYWNNSLDLGLKVFDPELNTESFKILRNIKPDDLIDVAGKKIKIGDLHKLARENGVINTGWLGADIPFYIEAQLRRLSQTGMEKAFWASVPTSQQFIVARAMRNLGLNVENHARILNFLGNLKKGLPVEEAAAHVRKFLFDYSELTPFEANVMKRFIPFFTWTRKNLPLQLEYLLKKPGQYATLAKTPNFARWIAQAAPEDLPDWAKDMLMIRLPWTNAKGEPIYLSPDLPPEDLEVFNAVPGLSQDLKKGLSQEAMSRVSPALRVPIEWISNYNFFFAAPRYPGQTAPAPWWMGKLPEGWQEAIGVTEKRGEKRISAETAWLLSQIPGTYDIERALGAIMAPAQIPPTGLARYMTGLRLYAIPQRGGAMVPQQDQPSKNLEEWYKKMGLSP